MAKSRGQCAKLRSPSLPNRFEDVLSLSKGKRHAGGSLITLTQFASAVKEAPGLIRGLLPAKRDVLRKVIGQCGARYGLDGAIGGAKWIASVIMVVLVGLINTASTASI